MNNVDQDSQGHLYVLSPRGYSAYEVAVQQGFIGTEDEWLESLIGPEGPDGKSAYDVAVDNGYEGTEEEWTESFLNADGYYDKEEVDEKLNVKPYYFDTVADMKSTTTNLTAGDMVITLGFHSIDDGGSAKYIIRGKQPSDVIDEMLIIEVNDLCVAELIKEDTINVEQLGAYGDGVHDDTVAIQTLLNKYNKITLNKTYLVSSPINVPNNAYVNGTGTLKANSNIFILSLHRWANIKDINIDGNNVANGIISTYDGASHSGEPTRNIIKNIRIDKCIIGIETGGVGDIISSCVIDNKQRNTNSCGINNTRTDNFINNCVILRCDVGVYTTSQISFNGGKILVCNYGMIIGSITNDTLPAYPFKITTQITATNVKLNNLMIQECRYNNILIFRAECPLLNIISEASGDSMTSIDVVDPNGYPISNLYCETIRNGLITLDSHILTGGGSEKYCVYLKESTSLSRCNLNINCDTERTLNYNFKIINSLKPLSSSGGTINGKNIFYYGTNNIGSNGFTKNGSSQWTIIDKGDYKICEGNINSSASGHHLVFDFELDSITDFQVYTLISNYTLADGISIRFDGSNDQSTYSTIITSQDVGENDYDIIESIRSTSNNSYKYIKMTLFINTTGYYKFNLYNKVVS